MNSTAVTRIPASLVTRPDRTPCHKRHRTTSVRATRKPFPDRSRKRASSTTTAATCRAVSTCWRRGRFSEISSDSTLRCVNRFERCRVVRRWLSTDARAATLGTGIQAAPLIATGYRWSTLPKNRENCYHLPDSRDHLGRAGSCG